MTNNTTPRVLIVGDVMLDYQYWVEALPMPGSDVAILDAKQNSGGSAANTAYSIRMQGVPCAFFGRIGDDAIGKQLVSQMSGVGIDLSCVEISGNSGYTVTLIDPSGERSMLSYRNSKDYRPKSSALLTSMLKTVEILYVSGYWLLEKDQAEFVIDLAKKAKKHGCFVVTDPAPTIRQVSGTVLSGFLSYVDMLMPNCDELIALSKCDKIEKSLDILLQIVPSVLLKKGSDGARLVARPGAKLLDFKVSESVLDINMPAQKITPVDTTGAGDSFNAGFISAFLEGGMPENWLEMGNRLAAKTIANKGAVHSTANES